MKKIGRPRIKLTAPDEVKAGLAQRIKNEKDAGLRDRMRSVLLAFEGTRRLQDIASQVGRARSSVQLWLDAFEQGGLAGLLTREKPPGKPSAMQAPGVQKAVESGLREGLWRSGPQFAAWLRQTHGIKLCRTQVYYWLGKACGVLKVPRPVHIKNDPVATEAFKEHLYEKLCALGIPAGSSVKVWVLDEARVGLHDPHRRCWSLRGVRVVKPRQQDYEWCYVYGALDVVGGDAQFQLMPTVGLDLTRDFLAQIVASDPQAHHVIIWDGAGFHHRDGDARLPPRVHLLPLPAYSPELNPPERLWDMIKDELCNKVYQDIEALEDAAFIALQPFIRNAQRVRQLVGNGWLYVQANAS
jgi:transposase